MAKAAAVSVWPEPRLQRLAVTEPTGRVHTDQVEVGERDDGLELLALLPVLHAVDGVVH